MADNTHIFVKYRPKGSPDTHEPVEIAVGQSLPLPSVGDTVDCKNVGGAVGQTNKYKVLSRYLTYWENHCSVFLTVTDDS